MLIAKPVIVWPWLADWEKAKTEIAAALANAHDANSATAKTKETGQAVALYRAFLDGGPAGRADIRRLERAALVAKS
jgi:hypothetical protein